MLDILAACVIAMGIITLGLLSHATIVVCGRDIAAGVRKVWNDTVTEFKRDIS